MTLKGTFSRIRLSKLHDKTEDLETNDIDAEADN
jgi:hypothetical protein